MRLRRASALTAALAVALTLGLTACAQKVVGTPVAAAGKTSSEKTTSGKPSATKPSAKKSSVVEPTSNKPATGKVKITTKKKTEGYEDCDILTPEEVAAAIGATKAGEKGCVQSTEDPFAVVLFMVTFAEYEGEAREIEIGGNTAYEVKEKSGDCSVLVMLTDDPDEITPAFLASVTPIDEINPCEVALKLATKGFEKIPNA